MAAGKLKKKQKLRNNEYYDMQYEFDKLYRSAQKGYKFNNLMSLIMSKENIKLAYRNVKRNKGSSTPGIDKIDINYFADWDENYFIEYFQNKFRNYNPKGVKRVLIPKPNGDKRPLGIPCMEDRIIQQCIKQVMEPICEAKFHKHSYGFRPNRSCNNAIARCYSLINKAHLHYVVDVDIKGFFDNVKHSKLLKQLWNLGIQDKSLLCIIGKILKSEIEGIGIPEKGTPQGGIISPLLANIVLNELDWWISSQWETMKTQYDYKTNSGKYRTLKNTDLKEIWLVRYADDFKIFCRDYKTAQKIFCATKGWLKERLELEVSLDKSKVTNLRKNYTEYLGFKLKAKPKANKYVCQSHMTNKALNNTITKLKNQIKLVKKYPTKDEMNKLNSIILGSHNYYRIATNVNLDFAKINFIVFKSFNGRFKKAISHKYKKSKTYNQLYGKYTGKAVTIANVTLFPIYGITTIPPKCFSQDVCNYTEEGRLKIHNNLNGYTYHLKYLLKRVNRNYSVEFVDNSISLMAAQKGKCYITGNQLDIHQMQCHHKLPKSMGGTDEYKNLVWLEERVHRIVHMTDKDRMISYLRELKLDDVSLGKLNTLRKHAGNLVI